MRNSTSGLGWTMACTFGGLATAFLLYGYDLINEPAPRFDTDRRLLTETVEQGGYLTLQNAFTAEKKCAGFFNRAIYSGNGNRLYSESEYRPAAAEVLGRHIQTTRSFRIPEDAPIGHATYNSVVEWQCNAFQRIWPQEQVLPELSFEIIAKRPTKR